MDARKCFDSIFDPAPNSRDLKSDFYRKGSSFAYKENGEKGTHTDERYSFSLFFRERKREREIARE